MNILNMFSKKSKDKNKQEKEPLVEKEYDPNEVIKNLKSSGFASYAEPEEKTPKNQKP